MGLSRVKRPTDRKALPVVPSCGGDGLPFSEGNFRRGKRGIFEPALPCVRERTEMIADMDLSLPEIAHATMRASAPPSERTDHKSQIVSIRTIQREISTH